MIRFRTLFQVDIAHDYFLSRGSIVFEAQAEADRAALQRAYSIRRFLEIFPDDATQATLAGHKMLFRQTDDGFLVAVQVDATAPDVRPAVAPTTDFKLTFALRLVDTQFANYTELGPAHAGFLRFGNDSQNHVSGTNYLTRPIADFSATRRYVAGETRAQPSGPTSDLFLALRDTGPAAAPIAADWRRIPADTYDPSAVYQAGALVLAGNRLFRAIVDDPGTDLADIGDWQPAGVLGNQYVGAADAAVPVSGLFNLDLGGAALTQATIRVFRAGDVAVALEQTFTVAQGVLDSVQVDLRGFAPGPYRLEILDASLASVPGGGPIYLAPSAKSQNWSGVIEIGPGAGNFALLNGDGSLRAPHYVLRFLNRATRWRYIFPAAQAIGAGADVALEPGSDRRLITPTPRPLTRFGAGARLQADDATTPAFEEVLLPSPDPKRIRRHNAEWFSDIHVSNLNVGP